MNQFSKLGLSPTTLEVLENMGFKTPTPIQQKAIPMLLENDPTDFIGLAQTGTGKTAAFGLPLVELIDMKNDATQALIMAPTRELGQQTAAQIVEFAKNNRKLNVEVVYGGAAIYNQIKALKKPVQIIVATPGRLLDLIRRKAVNLEQVEYVVLDEADEMLNMGFKEDIDKILTHTGQDRAIWLFSATMPTAIRRIIKKYMDAPLEVVVSAEQIANKDITHQYVTTKVANKVPALRRFLDIQPEMRGILFCRTKRETREIADQLGSMGYTVEALNGDMSQSQRDEVMRRFKTRAMQLLIATDVAARGIDVKDLTHVMHHKLPDQLENYTHRSGRTARAGKKGISLVFINSREVRKIEELEKKVKIKFQKVEIPSVEVMKSSRINHWADLIINTKVDDQADDILKDLHGQFSHLSKEDILKRLITTQLDHLMIQDGQNGDLNEGMERRSSRGGKNERSKREGGKEFSPGDYSKDDYHRYFVNVGSIDGVTKADLIHFLSDVSGVERKFFGDMSLQKNCAYFDIDKAKDRGLSNKFKGIEIEGRFIRVNRDDDGRGGQRKGGSSSRPGRSDGKRKSRRRPNQFGGERTEGRSPSASKRQKGKRKGKKARKKG